MIEHANSDKNNTPDVAAAKADNKLDKKRRLGIYAKSPGPRTQEEWRRWLGKTNFVEGDLDKKARLMLEFQRGVDHVETEAIKQGLVYKRPAIGIITTERNDPGWPQRVGEYGGMHVFIATWYLEEASRYGHEEPVWVGATVPDLFLLFGIEEAHHALFDQREGVNELPRLHPDTTPVTVYHAQDHEYEALEWKVRAARALGFPQETVETLQQRLDEATAVRAEQAAKRLAVEGREQTSTDPEETVEDTAASNSEDQESADDSRAVVLEDTQEAPGTLSDQVNASLYPEEPRLDGGDQESDTQLHLEEHAPADNGQAAGPYLHSPKGATSYRSREHGEQGAPPSDQTMDTAHHEQDHDDGRED